MKAEDKDVGLQSTIDRIPRQYQEEEKYLACGAYTCAHIQQCFSDDNPRGQCQSDTVGKHPKDNVSSVVFNDQIIHLTTTIKV